MHLTASVCAPFQSTPSVWRATAVLKLLGMISCISIHALRVEGDSWSKSPLGACQISIHALRVEGDNGIDKWGIQKLIFQSTPSVWRATT